MLERALGRVIDNDSGRRHVGETAPPEPAIQIRAARALLSLGLKPHEAVDVTEQLRVLQAEVTRYKEGTA
jgi:hypothetical protein